MNITCQKYIQYSQNSKIVLRAHTSLPTLLHHTRSSIFQGSTLPCKWTATDTANYTRCTHPTFTFTHATSAHHHLTTHLPRQYAMLTTPHPHTTRPKNSTQLPRGFHHDISSCPSTSSPTHPLPSPSPLAPTVWSTPRPACCFPAPSASPRAPWLPSASLGSPGPNPSGASRPPIGACSPLLCARWCACCWTSVRLGGQCTWRIGLGGRVVLRRLAGEPFLVWGRGGGLAIEVLGICWGLQRRRPRQRRRFANHCRLVRREFQTFLGISVGNVWWITVRDYYN